TTLSESQAITAIDTVFDSISRALAKGESVHIRGFATFKAYKSKERTARNINAGTPVTIPERNNVKLKPGKNLKNSMNK
ncbi:MAG: HU family DNA-binding protein, partial [Muribaculaceae bacterium]